MPDMLIDPAILVQSDHSYPIFPIHFPVSTAPEKAMYDWICAIEDSRRFCSGALINGSNKSDKSRTRTAYVFRN